MAALRPLQNRQRTGTASLQRPLPRFPDEPCHHSRYNDRYKFDHEVISRSDAEEAARGAVAVFTWTRMLDYAVNFDRNLHH